ncbi:MAG: AAA domain-containing protein [Bacillales bacterium]
MNLEFNLKLSSYKDINEDFLNILRDDEYHDVKISTTKKNIEIDKKDSRYISSLKNVKIIYKKEDGGILILIGNLQCDFKDPFGGAFFLKKYVQETTEFEDVKGVNAKLKFGNMYFPTSIEYMRDYMQDLVEDPNFEFNISQFDEFMEIFEFYKKLSDELNNNFSYKINGISKEYYFIQPNVKEFDSNSVKEVKDQNGVIKGYKIDNSDYVLLKNYVKDQVKELVDIRISGGADEISRIRRVGLDNIYLSNSSRVSEKEVKYLKQFIIYNIVIMKNEVVISGELKSSADYKERYEYLNLYDMGQKIKIESVDNSLRLINQGATGAASNLLQYLIGDVKMPNNIHRTSKIKEKYMEGLNESQRKAFLMSIDGSPVSLIKGPPGTGKTHVINSIVQYITKELGEKVIISSQTHIAIDNVLDKLVENYDLIIPNRITNRRNKYSGDYIDDTLYKIWGVNFFKYNAKCSDLKLKKNMEESVIKFDGEKKFSYSETNERCDFSVIGATTTTSAIAGKKGLEVLKGFDWLIIDEVSKCPITEVLRYIPYVNRIIMVGDDFQLAPLLEFSKEDVKGLPSYNEELFQKLQTIYEQSVFSKVLNKAKDSNRLVLLNENYRSVNQVLKTYNVFYDGALKGKREDICPSKVHIYQSGDIDYDSKDVMFVEVVGGQEVKEGTSRVNVQEIEATAYILKDLIKYTINPEKVTVSAIFPYAAQINHFHKNNIQLINQAKKVFKSFEIDTIDAFQGKETDIVLVNTVVADSSQKNFLNDFRRINVSMSRARDKLILFGNSMVLKKIKMKINGGHERQYFEQIINYISSHGNFIRYEGGNVNSGNTRKSKIKLA